MFRPLIPLLLAPVLLAQAPPRGRDRMREHPPAHGPFLRQLRQMRLERIRQSLNLPEDKAKALVERWEAFDREFMQRARRIRHLQERFNEILLGPGTEEEKNAKAQPPLDQYLDLRRQQFDSKQKFEEEVRAQLPPAQQLRFILLVEELQRNLRETMSEAMRDGRGGRRSTP